MNLPPWQQLRALWKYTNSARDFITAMKYHPSQHLARIAGKELAAALPHLFKSFDWDLVVPIPSSPNRLAKRGFNQCTLLAKPIAAVLPRSCRLSPQALTHQGHNRPQATLPTHLRWKNMQGAFIGNQQLVSDKRILLIDDVITTGASINAATAALLISGAAAVDVLVLACSPFWCGLPQQ